MSSESSSEAYVEGDPHVEQGEDGSPQINAGWRNQTVAEQQQKLQEAGRIMSVKDTRSGKTVSGTTADDKHDEHTVVLPGYIDADDLSAKQEKILKYRILYPNKTQEAIAEMAGTKEGYVSKVVGRNLRDETRERIHKKQINQEEREGAPTVVSVDEETEISHIVYLPENVAFDDLTPKRENVLKYKILYPEKDNAEIARLAGCSDGYIPMTLRKHLTDDAREKLINGKVERSEGADGITRAHIEGETKGIKLYDMRSVAGAGTEPYQAPTEEPVGGTKAVSPSESADSDSVTEPESEPESADSTTVTEPESEPAPETGPVTKAAIERAAMRTQVDPTPQPEPDDSASEALAEAEARVDSAVASLETLQPVVDDGVHEAIERVLCELRDVTADGDAGDVETTTPVTAPTADDSGAVAGDHDA